VTGYRLLHIAYDPREWWQHQVWDLRVDPRIPTRRHEPQRRPSINFSLIEPAWLREGAQRHGTVGIETGALRWASVSERVTGLAHFGAFLVQPQLTGSPHEIRLLALEILRHLRTLRAQTGPNRGQPLSDSHLVHVMGMVEQFYAGMTDHRHEAASRLGDQRAAAARLAPHRYGPRGPRSRTRQCRSSGGEREIKAGHPPPEPLRQTLPRRVEHRRQSRPCDLAAETQLPTSSPHHRPGGSEPPTW
jgi:hypothetical protein